MPNGLVIPGGVSFPLLAPDGTALAPSYSFASDPNTGMYSAGADSLGLSAGGTLRLTVATAGITATVPVLAPNGTVAAPSYACSSYPTNGLYFPGSGYVGLSSNGSLSAGLDVTSGLKFQTYNDVPIGLGTGLASADVLLYRDAANVLAQRNGVNAQTFRLYGTYTDAGNNEYLALKANAGAEFQIIASKSGTGTYRSISFVTSGLGRWYVNENGVLGCHVDNTVDLGASGTARPRNIYAGTSFVAPNGTKAAPSIVFAGAPTRGFYAYQNGVGWGNGADQEWSFSSNEGYLRMGSFGLAFSSGGNGDSTVDLLLKQLGAASLRQGLAPSATPIAQTFTIGEASRPGTDTNVGGANGTIRSGLGTGTGTASSLIFQTPDLVASGSTTQTYATRLTVATAGVSLGSATVTTPLTLWGAGGACTLQGNGANSLTIFSSVYLTTQNATDTKIRFYYNNVESAVIGSNTSPGSLLLGAAPSATPINQTFTIGESSRGGTDLNVAGANGTIRSGLGTGNAAGTSLIFQVSVPLGSSTVAQTYTQVLSLSALGATFDIPDQGLRINGQVSGAGAGAGTLTNAPAAGNPNFWLPINCGGTVFFFPGW